MQPGFELLLIGDTGAPETQRPDPVLQALRGQFPAHANSALVFLGDIVYPKGLPPKGTLGRSQAEARLNVQLDAVKDFPGKLVFITGNHDWKKPHDEQGYNYMRRMECYIADYLVPRHVYTPAGGCPGPTLLEVGDNLALILVNTQWWMEEHILEAAKQLGCTITNEEQFYIELHKILQATQSKVQVVAGHLPVYSDALHGGKFRLKDQLFPLRIYNKKAYVPLPILGSLFAYYRRFFGAKEDMAYPAYRRMRNHLIQQFQEFPNLIYASGHEHNLQYIYRNQNHFIVSGAGSKTSYVLPGGHSKFAAAQKGFFKLLFAEGNRVVAQAWTVNVQTGMPAKIFEAELFQTTPMQAEVLTPL